MHPKENDQQIVVDTDVDDAAGSSTETHEDILSVRSQCEKPGNKFSDLESELELEAEKEARAIDLHSFDTPQARSPQCRSTTPH